MPKTLDEKIAKVKEEFYMLQAQQRLETRQKLQKERKKAAHRHLILGELVEKYFPEVRRFEPGTKAKNLIAFELFEIFLSVLSAEQETIDRLKKEAINQVSLREVE